MLVSYKETELDLAESSPLLWVAIAQNTLGGKQRRPYSLHCTAKSLRFREAQWNRGAVDAGKAWTSFLQSQNPGEHSLISLLPPQVPVSRPQTKRVRLGNEVTCHPPTVCTAFIMYNRI